jgi:hypothetical protein
VSLPRFGLVLTLHNIVNVYRPLLYYSEPIGSPTIDRMYLLRTANPWVVDANDPD